MKTYFSCYAFWKALPNTYLINSVFIHQVFRIKEKNAEVFVFVPEHIYQTRWLYYELQCFLILTHKTLFLF